MSLVLSSRLVQKSPVRPMDLTKIAPTVRECESVLAMSFARARKALQKSRRLAPTVLLLLGLNPLCGQTLDPTPGFQQDLAGQFPLPGEFSLEEQIQIGMQGNDSDGNPFAYGHALQFRPWLHYDGISNLSLTGSVSYIKYFAVPATSNYKHPEWRNTLMGTLKQPLPGGSLYEQIRVELLNFHDSKGVVQHLPRIRIRFGQNVYLGEGGGVLNKPFLGLYQEVIMQFPKPSYSHVTFTSGRFFAGAGFELGSRTQVLLGFKAAGEVSSSGSPVTLFFGPAFSIEYNFRQNHPVHENHQRTTAFKDF